MAVSTSVALLHWPLGKWFPAAELGKQAEEASGIAVT